MKKNIILITAILVLIGLSFFTYRLVSKRGKSDEAIAAFNFEIKDTASITRIIITEPSGAEMDLVREGKTWQGKNGECVQQGLITSMLDAVYNVRFKGYVPENSMRTVTNRMATVGTKVQYYVNGEWYKTWYIGSSTPDHYGTYMLVESEEAGKSDLPVIAEIKGMKGIISPRFFADPRKWACTQIFALQMNEITNVNVNMLSNPAQSFQVKRVGRNYQVSQNGRLLPAIDTNLVYRYLLNYKRINFELPNFELTDRQLDSLKKSRPFCELSVSTTKGKTTKLRLFRRKSDSGDEDVNDFGEKVTYDINRFWCQLPSGQVVKCQYFVFNPLLMGNIYFQYQRQPATIANTNSVKR